MLQHDKDLDKLIISKQHDNSIEHLQNATSTDTHTDEQSLIDFKNSTINNIMSKFNTGQIEISDGLKQFVHALAIVDAVKDKKVKHKLTKNAAKSLKTYTKSIAYNDESGNIDKRKSRNESFYKAFRPILEFDLSHLTEKNKTKTTEEHSTKPQKTYDDRSYGLTLMCIMIVLLIVPYCICNICLAIFNGINAIFDSFNAFGKVAFWLCTSIAAISIVCAVVYVLLLIIEGLSGVQIFPH